MFRTQIFIYILLLAAVCTFGSHDAHAAKRVALVIGNSAYTDATPLKNPLNDAIDIAKKLRGLDFEVLLGVDLKLDKMLAIVRDFARKLSDADTALIFFAGHALQVNGENYLAPIDTKLQSETDLQFDTVSLNQIMGIVQSKAKTLLVFLDACRDNPLSRRFVRKSRSFATQGLAQPKSSAEGTFIAFSTEPGNVALDGSGRNSPFTSALLNHIDKPGVEIASLMTDVRSEVFHSTNRQQLPWTNSGLLGRFYFNEKVAPSGANPAQSEQQKLLKNLVQEKREWVKIQNSADEKVVSDFLTRFPDGAFSAVAKFKQEQLKQFRELAKQRKELEQALRVASLPKIEPQTTVTQNDELPPEIVTKELVRSVQLELDRLGCQPGTIDGLWGAMGRRALTKFAKHSNLKIASVEPNSEVLKILQGKSGRMCPISCSSKFNAIDGQCVLKTCKSGQKLSSKGQCYKPKTVSSSKRIANKPRNTRRKPAVSSNCFVFNGKRVCE